MGLGIDIRIDADRYGGASAKAHCDVGKELELGFGLDVEAGDAFLQGCSHFACGLANPREHDLAAGHAQGQGAPQFTFGDDIDPSAEIDERLHHRLIGIRLSRIEDRMIGAREGLIENVIMALERRRRITIERRADILGKNAKADLFDMKHAVSVGEMMH